MSFEKQKLQNYFEGGSGSDNNGDEKLSKNLDEESKDLGSKKGSSIHKKEEDPRLSKLQDYSAEN